MPPGRPGNDIAKVQDCADDPADGPVLARYVPADALRFLLSAEGWPYLLVPLIPIAVVLD